MSQSKEFLFDVSITMKNGDIHTLDHALGLNIGSIFFVVQIDEEKQFGVRTEDIAKYTVSQYERKIIGGVPPLRSV